MHNKIDGNIATPHKEKMLNVLRKISNMEKLQITLKVLNDFERLKLAHREWID